MPTNRFFYSEKQATCNGVNDANEVFNGKEWVKYSEWIGKDFMYCTCNWSDAVLVYETEDDNPQIIINPIKLERDFEDVFLKMMNTEGQVHD